MIPISSLDENRIYTTSYLVAKINQEIAGCILDAAEDKRAGIYFYS